MSVLNISGTQISSLKIHSFVNLNIKNTPNLFCLEVPTANLTQFYSLSMDNFDFGDVITDNCAGVLPLDPTEKTAIETLYTATNGDSWSYRTYASTIITEANDTRGFEFTNVGSVRKFSKLLLASMSLNGGIPTEIEGLTELAHLNVAQNSLNTMPTQLGNLANNTSTTKQ